MKVDRNKLPCLVIGYLHLISSLVDIGFHLLVVCIVTSGFQCDVDVKSLRAVDWPWLQPLLLVLNLGTHGFYPFPVILSSLYSAYVEHMPLTKQPKCYPGMLHVYLVDVFNFLINLIWLRLVISFIAAVHKRDPDQMRMFYGLSIMKVVLQIIYLIFQPTFITFYSNSFWFLEILDVGLAVTILIIINNYIKILRAEKAQPSVDQPPPYIECLITTNQTKSDKNVQNIQPAAEGNKGETPAILPI
ncbi:uncharacterized protein [Battus philenor]|uniref:uncharacterized protein n=1 Tax=Battus philenor TaxID=42288 RepID=UPI0035CF4763